MLSTAPAQRLETTVPSEYWASDTAVVRFAPGVWHQGDRLHASGRDHVELNPVGQLLAENMSGITTIGELTDVLSREFDLDTRQARHDVRCFVGDLQSRHLLSVEQAFGTEFLHRALGPFRVLLDTWRGTYPQRHRYPERRDRPTTDRILLACVRAYAPVTLTVVAVAVVMGVQHIARRTAIGQGADTLGPFMTAVAVCLTGYVLLGLLSSIVHELGHFVASRTLGVNVRSIFTRFSRAGVAHNRTHATNRAIIAASGGLPGAIFAGAATIALLVLPLESTWVFTSLAFDVLVVFGGLTLMLFHIASLTPITNEGRRLCSSAVEALRS